MTMIFKTLMTIGLRNPSLPLLTTQSNYLIAHKTNLTRKLLAAHLAILMSNYKQPMHL